MPPFEDGLQGNFRRTPSKFTHLGYPVAADSGLGGFDPGITQWPSPDLFGVKGTLAKNPYLKGNSAGQTRRTGQYADSQPSPSEDSLSSHFEMWASNDRDAAWEKCHARCAKQTVDKGLRSDAPLLYRRCMRECMAESGYFDYLSPPNLR